MASNESGLATRSVLYRILLIVTGLCISIGGFALGFILTSIQGDISEIRQIIAPGILQVAEERFITVEQRQARDEDDIRELREEIRELRRELNEHLRQ